MPDGGKQFGLVKRARHKAHRVFSLREAQKLIVIVNVIDLRFGMALQKAIQEGLQRMNGMSLCAEIELPARQGDRHVLSLPKARILGPFPQNLFRVHMEEHAVNRLELQGRTMQVDQFHHRVARGMLLHLCGREVFADVLPAGLGRGQRMVAVAHGVEQSVRF